MGMLIDGHWDEHATDTLGKSGSFDRTAFVVAEADSAPGQGSSFRLVFPALPVASVERQGLNSRADEYSSWLLALSRGSSRHFRR